MSERCLATITCLARSSSPLFLSFFLLLSLLTLSFSFFLSLSLSFSLYLSLSLSFSLFLSISLSFSLFLSLSFSLFLSLSLPFSLFLNHQKTHTINMGRVVMEHRTDMGGLNSRQCRPKGGRIELLSELE